MQCKKLILGNHTITELSWKMLSEVNHTTQLWSHENTAQSLQLHDKDSIPHGITLSLTFLHPIEMVHVKSSFLQAGYNIFKSITQWYTLETGNQEGLKSQQRSPKKTFNNAQTMNDIWSLQQIPSLIPYKFIWWETKLRRTASTQTFKCTKNWK